MSKGITGFGNGEARAQDSGKRYYLSGSQDPTVIATYGTKGSCYIRTGTNGGTLYLKQDYGKTTNWILNAAGGSVAVEQYNVPVVPVLTTLDFVTSRVQAALGGVGEAQVSFVDSSVDVAAGSPYAANKNTDWIMLCSVAATVIDLPAMLATDYRSFKVKDITGAINPAHVININGANLGEGGVSSFTINAPYRGYELHFHGPLNTWWITGIF